VPIGGVPIALGGLGAAGGRDSHGSASAFIASCHDVTPVEDCQKARVGLGLPSARSPPRAVSLGAGPASPTQSTPNDAATWSANLGRNFAAVTVIGRLRGELQRGPLFQPDFDGVAERLSGFTSAALNMIESWGARSSALSARRS
jgi:hypothetical protein